MDVATSNTAASRSFVVSLENRKRRGAGHERPDEILKAARELFLEFGVESVTTRQIAARVGISQTALYVYFSTKEEMLTRLAEGAWRSLRESLDTVEGLDVGATKPIARLRAIMTAFVRFWLLHPDDYRIIFMRKALRPCVAEDKSVVAVEGRQLLDRLASRVAAAQESGALKPACSDLTALSIWASLSGLVALRLTYPDFPWPPQDEHIHAMLEMIFQGCGQSQAAA